MALKKNIFFKFNIDTVSIGTDLVEVDRFVGARSKKKFLENTFTLKELNDCNCKHNFYESLAARFAAKEAVKKSIKENIKLNEIEIINEKNGAPAVVFLNKKIKKKYKSLISITHTKRLAQAICLTFITV